MLFEISQHPVNGGFRSLRLGLSLNVLLRRGMGLDSAMSVKTVK